MDVASSVASGWWTDNVPSKTTTEPQSLEELARLIIAERRAREAALAEAVKLQEWRFVHFSEEFRHRLSKVEQLVGASEDSPAQGFEEEHRRLVPLDDSSRKVNWHSLENRLASLEVKLNEALGQRHLEHVEQPTNAGLAEVEARLSQLSGHLSGFDAPEPLSRSLSTVDRLKTVEPLEAQDLIAEPRLQVKAHVDSGVDYDQVATMDCSEAGGSIAPSCTASLRSSDGYTQDSIGGRIPRLPSGTRSPPKDGGWGRPVSLQTPSNTTGSTSSRQSSERSAGTLQVASSGYSTRSSRVK